MFLPRKSRDEDKKQHVVYHVVVHHVYEGSSQEDNPHQRRGPSLMGLIILLVLLCSFLSMLAGNV